MELRQKRAEKYGADAGRMEEFKAIAELSVFSRYAQVYDSFFVASH
jgi:hypothetical protein